MDRKGLKDGKTVRRSVTLQKDVYEGVKDLSHQLGISPSAFISMTITTKVKDVEVSLNNKRGGIHGGNDKDK